jgi:hypothetical protein
MIIILAAAAAEWEAVVIRQEENIAFIDPH